MNSNYYGRELKKKETPVVITKNCEKFIRYIFEEMNQSYDAVEMKMKKKKKNYLEFIF